MNNRVFVRPEHLNHHGYLFGGALLKWVDEFAWITATLEFSGCTLVTIAMDNIVFRHRVGCGAILRFDTEYASQGSTSVTYTVDVYADEPGTDSTNEREIFSTTITFVRIDEKGKKCPLPKKHRTVKQ